MQAVAVLCLQPEKEIRCRLRRDASGNMRMVTGSRLRQDGAGSLRKETRSRLRQNTVGNLRQVTGSRLKHETDCKGRLVRPCEEGC